MTEEGLAGLVEKETRLFGLIPTSRNGARKTAIVSGLLAATGLLAAYVANQQIYVTERLSQISDYVPNTSAAYAARAISVLLTLISGAVSIEAFRNSR